MSLGDGRTIPSASHLPLLSRSVWMYRLGHHQRLRYQERTKADLRSDFSGAKWDVQQVPSEEEDHPHHHGRYRVREHQRDYGSNTCVRRRIAHTVRGKYDIWIAPNFINSGTNTGAMMAHLGGTFGLSDDTSEGSWRKLGGMLTRRVNRGISLLTACPSDRLYLCH